MISPDIHILTESDLEKIKAEWFARGKFEATEDPLAFPNLSMDRIDAVSDLLGDAGMPPDDAVDMELSPKVKEYIKSVKSGWKVASDE